MPLVAVRKLVSLQHVCVKVVGHPELCTTDTKPCNRMQGPTWPYVAHQQLVALGNLSRLLL
jgi:hypothetical protein